jgi:hypothetical protein
MIAPRHGRRGDVTTRATGRVGLTRPVAVTAVVALVACGGDGSSAKSDTPGIQDSAARPAAASGVAWVPPGKAASDDELPPADTFNLVTLGGRTLPAADTLSVGTFRCRAILTAARYVLDGNRNYLWSYTRDHSVETTGPCLRTVVSEDQEGSYQVSGDSIVMLRFDDGEAYRVAAGRIVRDTLDLTRDGRRELYVRHTAARR